MDYKQTFDKILETYRISMVGYEETEDDFGDTVYAINPHRNDLNNIDDLKYKAMLQDLAAVFNYSAKVVYADGNKILVKPDLNYLYPYQALFPWKIMEIEDNTNKEDDFFANLCSEIEPKVYRELSIKAHAISLCGILNNRNTNPTVKYVVV